jgi:solute:Na+ symporter, SSS family
MQLHTVDFIVLAVYMVGMVVVGFAFSKNQTSKEAYFLGNRRMSSFVAGISVVATLLSTMTYLAVPGEMIRYGIGLFSSLFAFVFIIPIVNRFVIPFLMSLPVTSVYEYIEKRFGLGTRLMAASAFMLSRIIWTGLIIYTASFAIAAMTGWSIPSVVVMIGLVTTLYTTVGGISAVMWTDVVQFFILFLGAVFTPIYIAFATDAGPGTWWATFSDAGRTDVPLYSFDPAVRLTVVGMIVSTLVWNICTHGADQVAAQRYLSTPSAQIARRSVWIFSIANITMILLLALVGLALFYFFYVRSGLPVQAFQEQIAPEADKVFPRFIAADLPLGVSGLILAALLAAAMSSLSSAINSISTVAVTDFFDRLNILRAHQDRPYTAMVMAGTTGLFGVLSALLVNVLMQEGRWNLVDLMERGNHLFVAPLGVLFFAGFLSRRAGSRAAVAGFIAGVATSVAISFSKEIFGLENPIGFVWNMPVSFVVSFAVTFLLGFVFPRKPTPQPAPTRVTV